MLPLRVTPFERDVSGYSYHQQHEKIERHCLPWATGRSRIRQKQWSLKLRGITEIETVTTYYELSGKYRSNVRLFDFGSPAILPWLINRSVLVFLTDMGFALPDVEEMPVTGERRCSGGTASCTISRGIKG